MDQSPKPRWLDAEERRTWIAVGSVLFRLSAVLDAQLQRDDGISHFDYEVLSGLAMSAQRTVRMSELAMYAEGSLSRLSQVVARLEKRGWVRRTPDPSDGRFTLAILTEDGWNKLVAAAPGHVDTTRRHVFDPLTKTQQRQLREICRRIMRVIDPNDRCLDDDASHGFDPSTAEPGSLPAQDS